MALYHGSKEIVEYPEIRKARFQKDFYFGFYCTTLHEQAQRWATRFDEKGGTINEYAYTPSDDVRYPLALTTILPKRGMRCRITGQSVRCTND